MLKKILLLLLLTGSCSLAWSAPPDKLPVQPQQVEPVGPDQTTPQAALEDFLYAFLLQDAEFLWQLLPPEQQQKLQGRQHTPGQVITQLQKDMRKDKHIESARKLGVILDDPARTAELIRLLAAVPGIYVYQHGKYFPVTDIVYQLLQQKLTDIPALPVLNQSSPHAVAAAFIHAMAIQDHLAIWLLASPASRQEAVKRCGNSKLALAMLKQKLQEKQDSPEMQKIRSADKDRFLKRMAIQYILSNRKAMIKLDGKYYIDYLAFL